MAEISERQIKINVNEYEYDDIVIVVSFKLILTKITWAEPRIVQCLYLLIFVAYLLIEIWQLARNWVQQVAIYRDSSSAQIYRGIC